MILQLFDGNKEFSMENIDLLVKFLEKNEENISVALIDDRGVSNNKNIEQIVEVFSSINATIIVILTRKDNISEEFVELVNSWLNSYGKNIKIGIVVESEDDFQYYSSLFKIQFAQFIMTILLINDNAPPIETVIEKISEESIEKTIFLEPNHEANINFKEIGNLIDESTGLRRKYLTSLQLGCGFPLCMFEENQIGNIFKSHLTNFAFYCVPKVIVTPELKANYCKKLKYKLDILSFDTIDNLYIELEKCKLSEKIEKDECKECWSYKKICGGGCSY